MNHQGSHHEHEWLDQPKEVRDEDQFDLLALDQWLRRQDLELAPGLPVVHQYPKGASNLTYSLTYGNRVLVLRRPPKGQKAASAHDMVREYRIQSLLAKSLKSVPQMLAVCEDEQVIGSKFYVMEHVSGLILRSNLPRGMSLPEERVRQLCLAAIDQLIELHSVDVHATGLDQLGKGAGYNQRQIEGWCGRFTKAKTWNVASGEKVMRWLQAHCPAEKKLCMIHGDYRFDNLVLKPNLSDPGEPIEIRAILDWELATIGDPMMDLGNSMAYWVQANDDFYFRNFRRQPTHVPGMLTREEVVKYYCERMGFGSDQWAFYEVYGLFRLAVIAQQIYYRYHHGQTRNPQFKNFWFAVNYLLWRCGRVIKRS